jgi:1-acyl-sn-glycerol-3-phosphate acyltransferase
LGEVKQKKYEQAIFEPMNILKSKIVWIVGVCYIVVTFPLNFIVWLLTFPFDIDRKLIHWFLTHESFILSYLIPIWKITIEGREKAKKGTTYVIISNHQSTLDIIIINCLRFKFKWISKIENFKVPVIGQYLKMADYIIVDRENDDSKARMLETSYNCLKKGTSIMMFPEGTRSLDNEIGFFKRGAFQLALQANVPILPVVIDGTGGILPKHGIIFGSGFKIKIRVMDPVLPEDFGTDIPEDMALKFSQLITSELNLIRNKNIR